MMRECVRPLVAGLLLVVSGLGAAADLVAPFVVTPERDVERMMRLAEVGPGDYLIDLGSGDGRIVIAAAERGAMGHGIELDANLVREARWRASGAGVRDQVGFLQQDLFEADFSRATVVTMYLMPDVVLKLRPRLLEQLAPGTRIVSNSFHLGDWEPERHIAADVSGGLYLWIVPADVNGDWMLRIEGEPEPMQLHIEQHFQQIEPRLEGRDRSFRMEDVRLHADRIEFQALHRLGSYRFSGRVEDDVMRGYLHRHHGDEVTVARWEARRGRAAP